MDKIYICDNRIFLTRSEAETYLRVQHYHNKFVFDDEIREFHLKESEELIEKKHKMQKRLDKMKEDFE